MLRAEIRKMTSTPVAIGLMAAAIVMTALGTVSTVLSAEPMALTGALHDQTAFLLVSINVGLLALLLGMRSFTDEFRYGTIASTMLSTRLRSSLLGAKVAVAAMAGVALGLVALASFAALALVLGSVKGATLAITGGDLLAAGGLAAAAGFWAAIGVAAGALIRHQVAAVVAGLVWVLAVENLGVTVLRGAGRFLPGQAAHALSGADAGAAMLTPLAGAAVLVTYGLVLGLAAIAALHRQEVLTA